MESLNFWGDVAPFWAVTLAISGLLAWRYGARVCACLWRAMEYEDFAAEGRDENV